MVRKDSVYRLVSLAWFAVLFFGGVGLVIGYAEGIVVPSEFPGGGPGLVGAFVVVGLGTILLVGNLQERSWKKAGRQAGLEPEAGGFLDRISPLVEMPDLVGEVDGRPVRVEKYTHRVEGGDDTKSSTDYTIVRTTLDHPIADGVHLAPEREERDGIQVNFMPGSASATADDRDFTVTGDRADAFEEAIRSGRAEGAIDDLRYFEALSVGDSSDAIFGGLGGAMVEMVDDVTDGDVEGEIRESDDGTSTVSHRTKGLILDGEEMGRQVEAVVAVADAAESVESGRNELRQ